MTPTLITIPSYEFETVTMRLATSVAIVVNRFTGQQQVYKFPKQVWLADVTLPGMNRAESEAWQCFFMQCNGPYNLFDFGNPLQFTPRGAGGGTPLVGAGGGFGTTLTSKGWDPSTTVLLAGDMIATSNYLYKVMADVITDGSGLADISVLPEIREEPTEDDEIVITNATGYFRLAQTEVPVFAAAADKVFHMQFSCIEATGFFGHGGD